jgi:hypothetical protein
VYRGALGAPLQYGNAITVDLSNLNTILPKIGASSFTMYIDSVEYNLANTLQRLVLVSGFIFRRNLNRQMQTLEFTSQFVNTAVRNLATDVQTNGNLYQPRMIAKRDTDSALTTNTFYSVLMETQILIEGFTHTKVSASPNNYSKYTALYPGFYTVSLRGYFAFNNSGDRLIEFYVNNTSNSYTVQRLNTNGSGAVFLSGSIDLELAAGDFVVFRVYANFTSTLNLNNMYVSIKRGCL